MNLNANLDFNATLDAVVTRANGTTENYSGLSTRTMKLSEFVSKLKKPMGFWKRLYHEVRDNNVIPIGLGLLGFVHAMKTGDTSAVPMLGLVTTAGINLLAADFVSGAGTHISAFNFHDFGTGTTAAAIGDTALQTPAGTSRVSGTQSTPVAGQYRTVGTVTFTSTLAITEWGLFSAATTGTLWDHRVFSAINVNNGDSISLTYTVSGTAGGS